MAFARTRTDRPESMLFRNPASPRDEPIGTAPLSPLRNLASRVTPSLQTASVETRPPGLPRRFTTNALPTLAPIGEQRKQAMEQRENQNNAAYNRISAAEKKAKEYEALLAQQRRIQAQMELIDPETRREVDDIQRLERDISHYTSGSGVFSEPTTPPDYHQHKSSSHSTVPYSNRFSGSFMTSPNFATRLARSGTQMTSPSVDQARPFTSHITSHMPSQSVPGSQRNSDHEGSDDDYAYGFNDIRHKAGANPNRNSMPVHLSTYSTLTGTTNPSSFISDEDDGQTSKRSSMSIQKNTISPDSKTVLQLHQTSDKFPILLRRDTDGAMQYNTPPNETVAAENQARLDRATASRHRQSLPPSAMRQSIFTDGYQALSGVLSDAANTNKNTAANRRSMEVKFSGLDQPKRPTLMVNPLKSTANGLPKPSSSYSTNDIPTLKNLSVASPPKDNIAVQTPSDDTTSPFNFAQSTYPASFAPANQQPKMTNFTSVDAEKTFHTQPSGLQASAQPFGPTVTNTSPYYGGYGMQMLNNSLGAMSVNGMPGTGYQYQTGYSGGAGYGQYQQQAASRGMDNSQSQAQGQGRGRYERRSQGPEDIARYGHLQLDQLVGEIYGLCKDQHGCRFLQRKLEERNPQHVQLIFEETNPHVVELMTDPFGNYLCQKLLEYCNDDQRTALIESASPSMVKIALNQHGTRALQKMIEFITKQEQIDMVIRALDGEVVQLIQDLNGNHVIQKCLNHLQQQDAQFIVDAVCQHVTIVGTHRHGCCVLQRCVDHASGLQKAQLVRSITQSAFSLVQDPFGNYVVQYIMDLGEPKFSEPICQSFLGNVSVLSRQKFSSNVVEKGIRTASEDTRRMLVEEMANTSELEKMLRDSFANYVVQTAMDYADPESKAMLIDHIRPILPAIRHTPHGRRIATKLQDYEGRVSGSASGQMTPQDIMPSSQPAFGSVTPFGRRSGSFGGFGGPSNGAPATGYNATAGAASGYLPNIMQPHMQRSGNAYPFSQIPQAQVHGQGSYHGYHNGSRQSNGSNHF